MNLGSYRLLSQCGAGPDGIAYQAVREPDGSSSGNSYEVRVLISARADAARWNDLTQLLKRATLLDHPSCLSVRELALEHDPPYAVMERQTGQSLGRRLRDRLPLRDESLASLACPLVGAIASAHRLGIVHGRLGPDTVFLDDANHLKIDFSGTRTSTCSDDAALAEVAASCRAPETIAGKGPDAAADVFSLGALLHWIMTGRPWRGAGGEPPSGTAGTDAGGHFLAFLRDLVRTMLDPDPARRPWANEVMESLAVRFAPTPEAARGEPPPTGEDELAFSVSSQPRVTAPRQGQTPPYEGPSERGTLVMDSPDQLTQLGRFRIRKKLGQGGMGAVYEAEDMGDGTVVAIKTIRPELAADPKMLQRFHKEARLLAEVNNPYVANLIEVNEDQGIHYLVLELVAGQSLGDWLSDRPAPDEKTALAILADVARALVAAHERGIVHRDIKPDNILLEAHGSHSVGFGKIKLSDFGLAGHVTQSESLRLTQSGVILGTPLYMSPEQCRDSSKVDPRTDVYSMGITLYRILAGRPPFVADVPVNVMTMHLTEPPPPLRQFNPAVSDGVSELVNRCLCKEPEGRYANAGAMLHDLERLLRGEPTSITVHPRRPDCDPRNVVEYAWTFELEASPEQIWPYVSDTDRLNRALHLPAVEFTTQPGGAAGPRREGRFRKLGMTAVWQEHPFEWVEARRMAVLREYRQGPFKWLIAGVELLPRPGGGTILTHRATLEPRGLLGRTIAAVEIGIRARRTVEQVTRRMDAALTGKLGAGLVDPFEEPANPVPAQQRRLDQLLDKLSERRVDPAVIERLGEFLAHAPDQEMARIRPIALANRFGLDPAKVVAGCLHGAQLGMFVLLWDLLCPVCRVPAEIKETLAELREHGRCEACNLDFTLDFANSVEMIFRAHSQVRASELATYCVGGPGRMPHVAAQVRVLPGERVELDLAMAEGSYRLTGPQLPFNLTFRVQPDAPLSRWEVSLARGLDDGLPRSLRTGRQFLVLVNDHSTELLVRLERTAQRADAFTAARAAALGLFRELFPSQVLATGRLVTVSNVTLLVTRLDAPQNLYDKLGDARAFALLHEYFRLLDERIRRDGGAMVKTIGEGIVAAFGEPLAAVRVALDLPGILDRSELSRVGKACAAVHGGSAMMATVNDHLDYFGTMVNRTMQLALRARAGELLLTREVAGDQAVAAMMSRLGLAAAVAERAGERGTVVHWLALPSETGGQS